MSNSQVPSIAPEGSDRADSAHPDNNQNPATPSPAQSGIWPLSKYQAFGVHVALSILVFSSLVAVMLIWWFPGKLFFIDGGWEGLKLVAMVDLVLGPALTLLLYKPGKPKLVMDMSMIAALQIAALAYGFYTTHQQRTVAIVHADAAFNTLSAAALNAADETLLALQEQPRELPESDTGHPRLLLNPPPGRGQFGKYMEELLNGYPQPHERSDQFLALENNHESASKSAMTLEDLEISDRREAVEAAVESAGLNADELEFYDFKARYANGVVIFDPKTLHILDYVVVAKNHATDVAESEE